MAIDVRRGGARPPQLRLDPQVDFTGGLNAIEDRFQLAPNESPDCLNVDIHRRGGVQRRRSVRSWGTYDPFGDATVPAELFEHRDQINDSAKVVATRGDGVNALMAVGVGAGWTAVTNTGQDEIYDHAMMNGKSWFACKLQATQSWETPSGVPDGATAVIPDSAGAYQNDYATAAGNIFPHCQFVESHGGFMWAAWTDEGAITHPTRVRFSHPGYADRWSEDDWIDVGDEDGDQIVAIKSFRDHLLVFMHRSVHAVFGYDRQNFQVVKVSSSVGAESKKNISVTPQGVWFFSPDRGVYFYNGDGEPQWAFEKIWPLMDNGSFNEASFDDVVVASVSGKIWVSVPQDDGTDVTFVFDPAVGAWVRYGLAITGHVEFQNSSGLVEHLASTAGNAGLIKLDSGTASDSFNDAASPAEVVIDSYYVTRWMDGGSPFLPKRYKKPEFIVSGVSTHIIQAHIYFDYSDATAAKTLQLNVVGDLASTNLVWDDDDGSADDNPSAQWDDGQWAVQSAATQDEIVRGGTIGGSGRAVAIKFVGPSDVQWEIRGFTLKYLAKKPRS